MSMVLPLQAQMDQWIVFHCTYIEASIIYFLALYKATKKEAKLQNTAGETQ